MTVDLTVQDVAYAAILAFFFTWLILNISNVFKIAISRPTEFNYQQKDLNKILQKCYSLFPKDIIQFRGETFTRGMNIRVTTQQQKIFEGQFIGLNNENMVCVLTRSYIVAQELDNIEKIITVEGMIQK